MNQTNSPDLTLDHVYVIDDDEACRTATARLVSKFGYEVTAFASAEDFLSHSRAEKRACAIVDNRMSGMSGMELQSKLAEEGDDLPLVFLTGYAETPLVVKAMQKGATTLLEKPVGADTLREAIRDALASIDEINSGKLHRADLPDESLEKARLVYLLSPREREVANLVATGYSNKKIAAELGLSEKTIEKHRSNCVRKLRVNSSAEMVRAIVTAEMMGKSL